MNRSVTPLFAIATLFIGFNASWSFAHVQKLGTATKQAPKMCCAHHKVASVQKQAQNIASTQAPSTAHQLAARAKGMGHQVSESVKHGAHRVSESVKHGAHQVAGMTGHAFAKAKHAGQAAAQKASNVVKPVGAALTGATEKVQHARQVLADAAKGMVEKVRRAKAQRQVEATTHQSIEGLTESLGRKIENLSNDILVLREKVRVGGVSADPKATATLQQYQLQLAALEGQARYLKSLIDPFGGFPALRDPFLSSPWMFPLHRDPFLGGAMSPLSLLHLGF